MDAGPAPRPRAQPRLLQGGRAQAGRDHVRDRPGAAGGAAALRSAARSTSWATGSRRPSSWRSRTTRTWGDNIVVGGQLHTGYVTMNVNVPPFDKKEVRQAVNHAINKDRIVRIINSRGGAGEPAPAALDAGLRQGLSGLRLRSGQGQGAAGRRPASATASRPCCSPTTPTPTRASPRRSSRTWPRSGIKAELRTLAQANVIAAGGEKDGAPMIWSGGMAWIADFPDPSNFYGPILGCGGAVPGGWNWSWYCNQALDQKAAEADAMADPAQERGAPEALARHLRRASWATRPGRRSSTSSASR